jgi:DNA integrity scanning protein DisA with diadenylate cyclase activity
MGQIKIAVLIGLSRNTFHIGDRLLCLSGVADSGILDTMFSLIVGSEFELFATEQGEDLPAFNSDVFERVLGIATSLAHDGREGRPVGTTFVIGDAKELEPFVDQMIFNPFRGYPEKDRNILDPAMEETIREFSAIDGAFLIQRDGVVQTAGTFLKSAVLGENLPRGLGARHKSAAAITAVTNALAVTISESTGTVTVFRGGKILIEVERPRTRGPIRPRRPSEAVQPGHGEDGGA